MNNDQAEKLRQRAAAEKKADSEAVVIGVISGKGGVGKSVFSVNFSIALSEMGKKMLIIDLDIGMGNIEHLVGRSSLPDIADCAHDHLQLSDAIFKGPGNISFIAGGNGLSTLFRPDGEHLDAFLRQIEQIKRNYDFILFDFGAGVTDDMLHYILAVHQMILVTTPEPPAMADGYSALKIICSKNAALPVFCVVNMTGNSREGKETWQRLSGAAKKYIHIDLQWLTALHRDNAVIRSVREQSPCVLRYPHSRFSIDMRLLARAFLVQYQHEQAVSSFSPFVLRVKKYFELLRGK
ncbi:MULTISPECIES: P-loop NTPase [unclassified Sporolactobacillus]|uniref:P-loop NTPase n=1 Tax=unclassified Sporolactobacillus TaxID=2628533 RepID=UPI00236829E4|nr:P-loop NTPase [Sporolactobacillus sp. CQH2019]MDD9147046.1 P-loop NTPase [Sporolactobacillus sp. CQH2019]